jgi:hypothetical protein
MPYHAQTTNTSQELGLRNIAVYYAGPTIFSKPHLDCEIEDPQSIIWSNLQSYLRIKGWDLKLTESNQSVSVVQNSLDFGYLHFLNLTGDIATYFFTMDCQLYSRWSHLTRLANINCVKETVRIMKLWFPEKTTDHRGFGQTVCTKFNY